MDNKSRKVRQLRLSEKSIAIVLIVVIVIGVLPMLAISFYNRPSSDDLEYSALPARAWRESGSVAEVVSAAAEQVKLSYQGWQGTFSAVFLFALPLSIFSPNLYFASTFALVGGLILSTLYLLNAVLVKAFRLSKWVWLIASLGVLLLSVEMPPSATEAFFWHNGGVFYTLFYSMQLFWLGLALNLPHPSRRGSRWLRVALMMLLSAVLGGGNYTTALTSCILMFALAAAGVYRKSPFKWHYLASLVLVLGSLIASAAAPGNSARATHFQQFSAVSAIIRSFAHAFSLIGEWTTLPLVAFLLLLVPLAWKYLPKSDLSFRRPFWVVAASVCLFASQLTPPLYAMRSIGSPRQLDIYFFAFLLLVVFDTLYCVGWLRRAIFRDSADDEKIHSSGRSVSYLAVLCMMVLCGLLFVKPWNLTTFSAGYSLVTGEAQRYARQMDQRFDQCEDAAETDHVSVAPVRSIPKVFKGDKLSGDAEFWINRQYREYFDIGSVTAVEK